MRNAIMSILVIFLVACQTSQDVFMLNDGDLLFCVAETSDMSEAIVKATASNTEMQFDHVALFANIKGKPMVIEASAKYGVCVRNWTDFLADAENGLVVKRINHEADTKAAIDRALSFVGQPYDWSYLPENGKIYCSELIYCSFIDEDGKSLFPAKPMIFRDADGNMPQFWTDLFKQLGEPIPEGIPGTNPNDMAKAPFLNEIQVYTPNKK